MSNRLNASIFQPALFSLQSVIILKIFVGEAHAIFIVENFNEFYVLNKSAFCRHVSNVDCLWELLNYIQGYYGYSSFPKNKKKIIGKLSKISYPANIFRYVNTVCMKQYRSCIQIQNAHTNSSKQPYEFGI